MKMPNRLKEDEKGMMIFAMLGVVIILISIFAGAYFAGIRAESQKNIIDLAEFKELERKIEKVERELENVAQEAGYMAVELVKENVGRDYTLQRLKNRVGEKTTEIFEDKFEERYSDKIQRGNLNLDFHLRPLKENQTDIEFISLYLKEEEVVEESWSEILGFFKVKRTVHANIENTRTRSFSTRKIEIEREVKTDFFILAERMRNFDPTKVRKMVDCMVSSYLNFKIYDLAFEEDIGFKESFAERFDTEWLERYGPGDIESGKKRENVWKENSTGFVEGFTRDEGKISRESLISDEEFIYISKLAVLLEQIRAFSSCDETLLDEIAYYFNTEDKTVLELIGEGQNNKVNLQGLIINLFQEKDVLSDEIFLPNLFLRTITEDGILSIIEDKEEWTDTAFWLMNDLVSGEIDDQEPWRYQEFARNMDLVSELDSEKSYLRVLFNIYSNSMDEVLKSFKVNSEEVEEFVREEIEGVKPLSWMHDVSIVGEEGIDQIIRSILHQANNLSMSFGFEEGSYDNTASPFFYMYFLNHWGFDEEEKSGKIVAEEIDNTGIYLGIQDKVKGEIRSRAQNFEQTAKTRYEEITSSIEGYNETEWYEGDRDQHEVWESLNKTLETLLQLKENRLFDERNDPYVSKSLEKNHNELEERIEDLEAIMVGLDRDGVEYTEKIIEMIEEYPGTKWRHEAYEYLYNEGEGNGVQENYLNLTDGFLTASAEELTASYNWSLEGYELAEHIDPGKRTDQSIGYRAIGAFTQEMVREFESPAPLDYSNPRNLFKLINQNIFDLKGSREGKQQSRLMSILRGEGDQKSENLVEDDLKDVSVDFTEKVVSSSNLDDIDGWWDEIAFEKSISSLENIRTDLYIISNELVNQNVRNEPYSDYADASFYRVATHILDSLIKSMSDYRKHISSRARDSGYTYRGDDGFFRTPVVSAPIGDFTLHEKRSLEHSGYSYSFDLEVEMDHESKDLIQLQKMSETGTRVYRGDISKSQEWVNPFSSEYSDHYSTALFVEYFASEMEIRLSSKGETRLVSERYSPSEFTGKFEGRLHSSFTEMVSPIPLLEKRYSPRSVSISSIADASLNRNVFNSSQNKVELNLEIDEEELLKDQDIVVEVLKKRGMLTYEPRSRRGVTNIHHILGKEDKATQKTLLSERIPSEEISDSVISIELNLDGIKIPDGEIVLDHIVVRIRTEIKLAHTRRSRDLDQIANSEEHLFSAVPFFSTSEQMYLIGDRKTSYLDVFRIENKNKCEFSHNSFDLVKNIPSDSWVIHKDGYHYLVDFEENLRYRDALSGTYRCPYHDRHQDELLIDPRSELDRIAYTSFPFIPENEYGYLVKNEFVPLYMSSSREDKNFYFDRMMPLTDDMDRMEWNSLNDTLSNSGYTINLENENGKYLYYELGEFNGLKRVDHSFERTKQYLSEFYQNEIHSLTFSTTDISQSGMEILRETKMIDDFAENDGSKRRSIFLAATFGLARVEAAEQFKVEYENFTLGSIAKSLDLIGENRTEILLEWLEEERESSREKELRAFLSFEDRFVNDLPNRTEEEDYKRALDSLDKKLEYMNFGEYRAFSINNLSDIVSLKYLQDNFKEGSVSVITGAGVTPSALEELYVSYKIDFEKFAYSIEMFSDSNHFSSVVRELNSGVYKSVTSLYMAANLKESRVEWMPFGEDYPYLLIDDDVAHISIRPVDSSLSVKEFIDEALKNAVDELPNERGVVLMEVKEPSSDEVDVREIESYIQNRVEHHDPLYQNISWVEFRVDGKIEYGYFHL